jgi:hypothetical protein
MLGSELFCKLQIVGERKSDDLPCFQCDTIGPIIIVKCEVCERMFDVCCVCAQALNSAGHLKFRCGS